MDSLSVNQLIVGTLCFVGGYGLFWIIVYKIYFWIVTREFTKYVFKLKNVRPESSVRDKLLRLSFKKHQVYELSAYMILGIAILVLIFCVYIFIFAASFAPSTSSEVSENYLLVANLSLRLGIAIIVIFITQVLLRQYRYCLRIANFYMARFDALLSIKEKIELDLKEAIVLFTPSVDVGKEPKSPFEGIWGLLNKQAGKAIDKE